METDKLQKQGFIFSGGYLENYFFYVNYDSGVPKGFVLGPLLYNVHTVQRTVCTSYTDVLQ